MRGIDPQGHGYRSARIGTILVKKFGGIGNVVLGIPMLRLLNAAFPGAVITVLVESEAAREILDGNPYVADIVVAPINEYKRQGWYRYASEMLKLSLRLRRNKYDLVVNGYGGYGGDSLLSGIFTFLVGGRCSVGYGRKLWSFLYSESLEAEGEVHEVERNLDLVRLIAPEKKEIEPELNLWISEEDRKAAEHLLDQWGISGSDLLIGIHPGSGRLVFKRWSPVRFARVADRLIEEFSARIVLFGGREEAELAELVIRNMKGSPINGVGIGSLKQTAALIDRCNLFISNDTGLMHIAAAMKVPVVAIFGPTNFQRTAPLSKRQVIVKSDLACVPCYRGTGIDCDTFLCLKGISVTHVLDAARDLLAKN